MRYTLYQSFTKEVTLSMEGEMKIIVLRWLSKAVLILTFLLVQSCASTYTPYGPPEPLEEDEDRGFEFPEETVRVNEGLEDYQIALFEIKK